ncbi:hypothetical protein PMAN_a1578 [Pseudoalteromonas marina]|uniref:hypothetical protein n=1 Tax=Pseudoalteromonas marina TaxID=267375 RepID=UPI0018E1BC58|nr:hypothetical protein [Pseudoalteromonas marina]KAF7780533.1 hypothetical protein PMAN_a1578 [Pseudoalteromonas marina]
MKYVSLFIFILCLASCTSNYRIRTQSNAVENKTEFSFPYSAENLSSKLERIFSIQNQIENKIPLASSFHNGVYTAKVTKFNSETYQFDFNNISSNFWKSDFYLVNGEKAKTTGKFQIILTQTGVQSTNVKVRVTQLRVINGIECCGPHGRYSRYTDVAPTTIEEYAFLYFIGEQLGVKMPPVNRVNNG